MEIEAAILLEDILDGDISGAFLCFVFGVIADKAHLCEQSHGGLQHVNPIVGQNPVIRWAGVGVSAVASCNRCNLICICYVVAFRRFDNLLELDVI